MVTTTKGERGGSNLSSFARVTSRDTIILGQYVLLAMVRAAGSVSKPKAQQRLRELASQQGLEWDRMDDTQRQNFIEELLNDDG